MYRHRICKTDRDTGLPGSITTGSDMHLYGFNFSALQYSIKKPLPLATVEFLFTSDGTIEEDGAVYTTSTCKSPMRFI